MHNNEKDIDNLFKKFNADWDTDEPVLGHQQRFLDRLDGKKKKRRFSYRLAMPIAAALLILLGIFTTYKQQGHDDTSIAKVSPQVKETQIYFTAIIEKELAKVEKEKSPETKKIIEDALHQMQDLEKDYDKLTKEVSQKGENRQIIHAMITNLQTRISFLEEVLIQIDNIKKLKETYHENNAI